MAAFKCKMCGGDLEIVEGSTVCECEFCGTKQTVPTADNEKKTTLFNRANRLRMNAEFDKAAAIYENIVAEYPTEAEAYWGLCLCAYGIEYVDDPATGEKKPTCHRTLLTSIMEDSNFEQACDNADLVARRVYRDEAKAIDRIQKDILSIVNSERPYDVFICYKETDENGDRTEDSVLAQEIYDALNDKGLKVFFARITLEDKLGQQYEPYIYAALSSAKVMLAVGTRFEYYDAVWVKNEWMRFLSMMKDDRRKALIPCYKDLDAYDMPKDFKQLQAQDMGKLGWLQDLTRGVMKLCGENVSHNAFPATMPGLNSTMQIYSPQINNLIDLAKTSLEAQNYAKAEEFCNQVISIDGKNGDAWKLKGLAIGNQIDVEKGDSHRREMCTCFERAFDLSVDKLNEQERIDAAKEIIVSLIRCLNKEMDCLIESYRAIRPKKGTFEKQQAVYLDSCEKIQSFCGFAGVDAGEYLCKYQDHFFKMCQEACEDQWRSKVAYNYFREDIKNYGQYWNRDRSRDEYVSEDTFRPNSETFSTFLEESECLSDVLTFCETQFNNNTDLRIKQEIYSILEVIYRINKDSCGYLAMETITEDGNGKVIRKRPFFRIEKYVKESYQDKYSGLQQKYRRLQEQLKVEIKKREEEEKKRQEEEKNARIEAYWAAHTDEKTALLSEQAQLTEQKSALKSRIDELLQAINVAREREKSKVPSEIEYDTLYEQIKALEDRRNSLGLFAGKEKKRIDEKIATLRYQQHELRNKVFAEKETLKARIKEETAPTQATINELSNELSKVNEQISAIDAKLTKDPGEQCSVQSMQE